MLLAMFVSMQALCNDNMYEGYVFCYIYANSVSSKLIRQLYPNRREQKEGDASVPANEKMRHGFGNTDA